LELNGGVIFKDVGYRQSGALSIPTDCQSNLLSIPFAHPTLAIKSGTFSPVFTQPATGLRHTESSRKRAWESLKKEVDISMGARYDKRVAANGKMRTTKVLSVVEPDFLYRTV